MAKFFKCCAKHTINFDSVCCAVKKDDTLYVYFSNGVSLELKGECKHLVEKSLEIKAYFSNNC